MFWSQVSRQRKNARFPIPKRTRVVIICNAFDEATRLQRGIVSDSPAASKKTMELSTTLRCGGVSPIILSLGRGRSRSGVGYFKASVVQVGTFRFVYSAFSEVALLSQVISVLSLATILYKLRCPRGMQTTVIYYNRHPAYIAALLVSRFRKFNNILELEDGEVGPDGRRTFLSRVLGVAFDKVCTGGAILSCEALASVTSCRPFVCYYGTTAVRPIRRILWRESIEVHLGGTISESTGAETLLRALEILRGSQEEWAKALVFHVSGFGEALHRFRTMEDSVGYPLVTVHDRLSATEYGELLEQVDIGLALKPVGGALSWSTFPSKVVEYAERGILVVTTDISDVRAVLKDSAYYLSDNRSETLIAALKSVSENRPAYSSKAANGGRAIQQSLSATAWSQKLIHLIRRSENAKP